jgi:hypothetical protein
MAQASTHTKSANQAPVHKEICHFFQLSMSLTVVKKTVHPEIEHFHVPKNQNCSQTKKNFQKSLASQLHETLLHKTRVLDF